MTKYCYFSGTGNSLWSAKKIAELVGGEYELINIGIEVQKEKPVIEADAVVLLFPAYAYGAPVIVRKFTRKAVFKADYIAVFATVGSHPGGAMAEVYKILKRKKMNASYCGRIPAVENYIPIFGSPKPEKLESRLRMQREATEEAARCVMERRNNSINTFRPFSAFVSMLFFLATKIFFKWYRVTNECNGCGICEKLCPVSAITMRNNKPAFSKKCQHCQGCINWCPRRAILFGTIKPNTVRYHHPEIGIAEISR